MKTAKYAIAAILGVIALATPRALHADAFNFSISGSGITASGVFTTNPEANGTFLVTGLAGTQNGQTMTLLAPNAFAGNDNLLYATPPLLDFAGLSYDVAGTDYNLQYDAPGQAPFVGYGDFSNTAWVQVNFAPTPVPEPSSLLLLGTGLVGLMGMGLYKKRVA